MDTALTKQPCLLRPASDNAPPNSANDVSEVVGEEIRHLRKAHNTKLSELSETTGLSVGYLSQIERGISSPSVKALHSISQALGVTISWFFRDTDMENTAECQFIVRAGRRRKLQFAGGITDELLSPNLGREMELIRATFLPGANTGEDPLTHRGEETGIIVSGTLELWLGHDHFVLEEGDSFAFPSDTPHRFRNSDDAEAVVIWAITPPSYSRH
ncbi:MAG: cupin domain-containing protein [Alphaproteobacteria bacterium]|nr:cupin domain-containing protein [Alphaproteobacteria bacterium]